MDFNSTIDLIIKDLREAGEIIDDLKKYPGVPPLEAELAKLKCRSAAEVISMLKTLVPVATEIQQEPVQRTIVQKVIREPVAEPLPVVEQATVMAEKMPVIQDVKEPVQVAEVKEQEKVKASRKEPESSILADRFSHLSNRFNEQLGSRKGDEDISDILKAQHVDSLSDAIGVNDKFFFIREIFNGNQNDYTQAILRLETTDSLVDARAVIMSYTGENSESEAVRQLLEVVKRKLPADE